MGIVNAPSNCRVAFELFGDPVQSFLHRIGAEYSDIRCERRRNRDSRNQYQGHCQGKYPFHILILRTILTVLLKGLKSQSLPNRVRYHTSKLGGRMRIRILAVVVMFGLMAGTAAPQTTIHPDARAVLQAAAKAMGADRVQTITITGAGTTRVFGQSWMPPSFTVNNPGADEDFPRLDMPSYTRVIDYAARYSREELVRRQGNNQTRGGGGIPIQGDQRQILVNSGNFAWNVNADNSVVAQPAQAEQRLMEIILTPHGFIKAALEAKDASAVTLMMNGNDLGRNAGPGGRKVTYVAFSTMNGKYRVGGSIDDQNLVERTFTWLGNPIMGDLFWQYDFTAYRDMAGIKFPGVLHAHWGDIRAEPHHGIEIQVSNITLNTPVADKEVPAAVRTATVAPVRAEGTQLAPGIWKIGGGSHHSIAVEFADHITVIEAPQNEERSIAAIREIQRVIPNKPIRNLVVTHHHFDHSGGVRTYVAHGATLITHENSREFFDRHVLGHAFPRTMQPDILSTYYPRFAADRLPVFNTIEAPRGNTRINPLAAASRAKLVLTDGKQTIELHSVTGLDHTGDMLIAYLPNERMLVNADLFSPPAAGAAAPMPNQSMQALRDNITRLRLDVGRHVGIHGDVSTHQQFMKIVGPAAPAGGGGRGGGGARGGGGQRGQQ
jgi:glyoxylase-like metal-dependent hydrolase (beta-lactamase superfamily II)